MISLPDGAMTLSVQPSIAWSHLLQRVRTQMEWLLSVSLLRSSAVLTVVRGSRASRVVTGQATRQSMPPSPQKNTSLVGFQRHIADFCFVPFFDLLAVPAVLRAGTGRSQRGYSYCQRLMCVLRSYFLLFCFPSLLFSARLDGSCPCSSAQIYISDFRFG